MSFSFETNVGDDRTARITATYPVAVPELGVAKGAPFPLNNLQEIWFTAKKKATDPDSASIFQKKFTTGGIIVSNTETNVAYVKVSRDDLVSLRPMTTAVTLVCDVQVKSLAGDVWTVAEGKWKFKPEITQGA